MRDAAFGVPSIDTEVAHQARMYNYLLGGSVNFEADRRMVAYAAEAYGGIDNARATMRANRDFLVRAVRWLAGEAGVRQFLDFGTGVPDEGNVHAVARSCAPDASVVYVDHDPVVLAHAHQLLQGMERTDYVLSDVRDTATVLERANRTLDLDRPVAVTCAAVLHVIPDDEAYRIIDEVVQRIVPGSFLALTHVTGDVQPERMAETVRRMNELSAETYLLRSHDQVARFFTGLEMVEPGLVPINRWRPEAGSGATGAGDLSFYGGVARKP